MLDVDDHLQGLYDFKKGNSEKEKGRGTQVFAQNLGLKPLLSIKLDENQQGMRPHTESQRESSKFSSVFHTQRSSNKSILDHDSILLKQQISVT